MEYTGVDNIKPLRIQSISTPNYSYYLLLFISRTICDKNTRNMELEKAVAKCSPTNIQTDFGVVILCNDKKFVRNIRHLLTPEYN